MSSTNSFKEHKRWCTWRWSSPSNGDFFVHQNLFYRPCFIRRIIWISLTSPVLITMLLVGMERCFSLGSVDGSDQDYELKNRNSNILQTITFDNVFVEVTLRMLLSSWVFRKFLNKTTSLVLFSTYFFWHDFHPTRWVKLLPPSRRLWKRNGNWAAVSERWGGTSVRYHLSILQVSQ